jgi:hypothetical protein
MFVILGCGLADDLDALAGRRCVADPEETAGPSPADGTNRVAGSTSDIHRRLQRGCDDRLGGF